MGSALRVIVVDDERLAREELCYQLDQLGDIDVVGHAGNGIEALSAVDRFGPDLVFLDVQMPGLGGFEVARRLLEREESPALVFVTAFDQHAIEAFEVNAVDYLLKPVEGARLELAVQRARRRIEGDRLDRRLDAEAIDRGGPAVAERRDTGAVGGINAQLEKILNLVAERQAHRERLAIKVGERFLLVQADE